MTRVVEIDKAILEPRCKQILMALKEAGFNKASVNYVTDRNAVNPGDLDYLLRFGAVQIEVGNSKTFKSTLSKFGVVKHGPEAGKVFFSLNFDLA